MRVGQLLVNGLDAIHCQNLSGRLAGELVGSMAGADGNRQGVDARGFNKLGCLIGIGQQLLARQFTDRAVPVLLLALARFERSEAAEFPFD
jgi:hypothetical protein